MSGPVTEFAYFAHKPGLDVWSQTTPEGKALQLAFDTALKQPGALRAHYGPEVENPDHVWLFLDWTTVEDHMHYRTTKTHDGIGEVIAPLLEFTKGFIKHVAIKPYPATHVLDKTQAPVTEVLCAWFPPDIDAVSKEQVSGRFTQFHEQALKTCSDFKGIASGWSVEDDVPIRGEEDKSGVMFVAFIGWTSVEAHMKFRETQEFKDSIGLLRTIPDLVKLAAFHVSCTYKDASEVQ